MKRKERDGEWRSITGLDGDRRRGWEEEEEWISSHLSFWQLTLQLALGPHRILLFFSDFSSLLCCWSHLFTPLISPLLSSFPYPHLRLLFSPSVFSLLSCSFFVFNFLLHLYNFIFSSSSSCFTFLSSCLPSFLSQKQGHMKNAWATWNECVA